MEENMKRLLTVLLLVAAITGTTVFAAGGRDGGNTQAAGNSGPVKLTVAMRENVRIGDFKDNEMTRMLEEGANVDLDFVMFPSVDYVAKMNLMIMGGGAELPDVIIAGTGVFDDMTIFQWAQEGAIIPLTKYYKDPSLAININEGIRRCGENFLPQITSPDGEIYGVPTYAPSSPNENPHKYWYYAPWVEKLGLKLPTTTEEFRTFLRTIVSSDPNGNGRRDEIGLTGNFNFSGGEYSGWFNYLMTPFVYAGDSRLLTVNNGVIGAAYNTPGWREGLKYIRSLFVDGSIPMEVLTQDRVQVNTLMNSEEVRGFSFVYYGPDMIPSTHPATPLYVAMPPLQGPNGRRDATFRRSTASITFLVSANCKNPEAAFRFGDMMEREDIGITSRRGKRGIDWDYAADVKDIENYVSNIEGWPISIVSYDDNRIWNGSGISNVYWRVEGPHVRSYAINNGVAKPKDDPLGIVANARKAYALYGEKRFMPSATIDKLIYTIEENAEIRDTMATLESYVTEMTANFLAGNRNIDTDWNAYLAELNVIGLPKVLSTVQKVYDRMNK
jgi:putative aldouronate transport system substrate-binding protein